MECRYERAYKKEARKKRKSQTFTKVRVSMLLWFGCIWITCSYALAFIGREQIAEELSGTVAKVVIATILGYLCKAYFETKEEQKLKYLREKHNITDGGTEHYE